METKCSNCSGPVFIPLDRGVGNCKNCGQLAGRYCPDCNIAMPNGIEYCSGCGRGRKEIFKAQYKANFRKELPASLFALAVVGLIILGGVNCVKGCERDSKSTSAQSNQRDAEDAQFVETEIRPLIEQAGAKLIYTDPHILRIQLPGPVSEYEAERLARTVLDRLPNGTAVKVLDDVGILRAEASNSIFSNR
jgi:hypothetical protein